MTPAKSGGSGDDIVKNGGALSSFFVNVNNQGIRSFIDAVIKTDQPNASTAQDVVASAVDVDRFGTSGGYDPLNAGNGKSAASNGIPYCQQNDKHGYGSSFNCGGLTCAKDDGTTYADSSTCVKQ